ncbi:hypothetical protein KJ567_06830 [Candidatus Bipolaricaulota bacterium]|nr:hypothetical protein [Candidatus Bipolaricaulota bacterium]
MRKSTPHTNSVAGNSTKYESYREAWSRIDSACEDTYFLEAITIEESIISDRIISYLSRPSSPKPLKPKGKCRYPGFAELVDMVRKDVGGPVLHGDFTDLFTALDQWRDSRNTAIHAIVKSDPGTPTHPVEDFLADAQRCAEQGKDLARAVCAWHKAQLKKTS